MNTTAALFRNVTATRIQQTLTFITFVIVAIICDKVKHQLLIFVVVPNPVGKNFKLENVEFSSFSLIIQAQTHSHHH